MKKFLLLLLLFTLILKGDSLKIATYNVENLFDLQKSGHEYPEYIPNSKSYWNLKNYRKKLKNLSKVIRDIDADIIALQEVESRTALLDLRKQLKLDGLYYRYFAIADAKDTTIKVALLSKLPILQKKEIVVGYSYAYRNILEVSLNYKNNPLHIFVNHWKSKSGPESRRIAYAKALKKRLAQLPENVNIIALGDFNSDYQEYIRFKRKRKHNDTHGITGINHILGTINYEVNLKKPLDVKHPLLYNLWFDKDDIDKRYSYIYRGKKEALDNILVNGALLDAKQLDYVTDSIRAFERPYLFKKRKIYRWQMRYFKGGLHHIGKGYSDHLPVVAEFSL